jgi:DNA-binding transcriptional LysR family regulator
VLRTVGESRRISGLEKAIGLRLLHRTTRQIEPTEAGQLRCELREMP